MKKKILALFFGLLLLAAPALGEHITWKAYFPEYKLGELIVYKGSTPKVSAEQFWNMARERNVNGWADNRLLSVLQLLEYAHDGQTNHPTYMRNLLLGQLYIAREDTVAAGGRLFHAYVLMGDGMSVQPLTIIFENQGGRETLVACERPFKQEVAEVSHLDLSYGIKLFDYGHQLLGPALEALESGDVSRARGMLYGVNRYESGNFPTDDRESVVYPEQRAQMVFGQGSMPVYGGPSKNAERLGGGKATFGSNDWCYWYGNKGDWALIEYELGKGGTRVGWVYYPAGSSWQADPDAKYFRDALAHVG